MSWCVDRPRRPAEPREAAGLRLGFRPDAVQQRVLESESREGILLCTRQWGKSTITAAKAVSFAWRRAGSLVLAVSPSQRQSGEFVRKAKAIAALQGEAARGDGNNTRSLLLANGSRIVGLSANEAKVRGFSAVDLLVVDEAARVPDELYLSLRPVLAVSNGAVWLVSTPWGKRGFFWETWEKAGPEVERIRVPATECARIPAEFLERERGRMGERWFRQEYLCEFLEVDSGLFSRDLVMGAVRADVEPLRVRRG